MAARPFRDPSQSAILRYALVGLSPRCHDILKTTYSKGYKSMTSARHPILSSIQSATTLQSSGTAVNSHQNGATINPPPAGPMDMPLNSPNLHPDPRPNRQRQ